jgi:Domain of Unknown Function (DUF1206)/PAP2 superfamily
MHSVSATPATRTARRASRSPAAHILARAGLTARGVIYLLIGWVALLVAIGHSSQEADQQGALQLLAGKPYGLVSLWLLGIGHSRGWWRWLFLIPAIAMPVLVALSRMYRGEHHPTDILASVLFSALWLTATTLLLKSNAHGQVSSHDEQIARAEAATTVRSV